MQKILFTHSYFLCLDPKQHALGQPYAPLGTIYAAALMRSHGFEVSLFDTMFAQAADEITGALEEHTPDLLVVYDDGFNYLTKMCLTNMREAAMQMIGLAKRCGINVIMCSSDATDHAEKYLAAGADFVLPGEGELSLLELVQSIQAGNNDHSHIQGLIYQGEEQIITTQRRAVLKQLDELPLPAWDLVDLAKYKASWLQHAGYFSVNIATTRGCPYKCNWCAKPIYGNRYNSRSPQNVVAELQLLQSMQSFEHVWFCDDIFGLKPGWVHEFAVLLEKENISIKFKIQSRADLLLQENYVASLAKAGCDNAWMGAESGSQKILDAMDKGITVEQVYQATRRLKEYHIKPSFFIQFGYLGEEKEDIAQTIKMINELLPHEIGISVSYPLPGTVFYEKVKNAMKEKKNWSDSHELALMFEATYQPSYYKQLHRYVHKSYRRHLALQNLSMLLRQPFKADGAMLKKAVSLLYYIPASLLERRKLNSLEKLSV